MGNVILRRSHPPIGPLRPTCAPQFVSSVTSGTLPVQFERPMFAILPKVVSRRFQRSVAFNLNGVVGMHLALDKGCRNALHWIPDAVINGGSAKRQPASESARAHKSAG